MRLPRLYSSLFVAAISLAILFVPCSTASAQTQSTAGAKSKTQVCRKDDSGLKLPAGFCATVFADGIGHARHMVVAPSGVVYVNTWSGEYYDNVPPHAGGFLVALQDKSGAGKADVIERFGETVQTGGAGGTGIGMYKGSIYAEINDRIVRYSLPAAHRTERCPRNDRIQIASWRRPSHASVHHRRQGSMYVDVATATNACQPQNRQPEIPGANPCTELETRGGIWRYDANKTNQTFSPAERYATGIRNAEGFAIDSDGRIFVTQHGRDQLHTNWPDFTRRTRRLRCLRKK